jgi:hypothetical protein
MTTAAKFGALLHLELSSIARPKELEIGRIMTVETLIVARIPSMKHNQILVFFGQNHVAVRVEVQIHCLLDVVASVARKAGSIPTRPNQFPRREADRGNIGELRIDRRERGGQGRSSPDIKPEGSSQGQERKGQAF